MQCKPVGTRSGRMGSPWRPSWASLEKRGIAVQARCQGGEAVGAQSEGLLAEETP